METIRDLYQYAVREKSYSLILVIEWMVYEQGVSMDRDVRNVWHILEKYGDALNPVLLAYERKQQQKN